MPVGGIKWRTQLKRAQTLKHLNTNHWADSFFYMGGQSSGNKSKTIASASVLVRYNHRPKINVPRLSNISGTFSQTYPVSTFLNQPNTSTKITPFFGMVKISDNKSYETPQSPWESYTGVYLLQLNIVPTHICQTQCLIHLHERNLQRGPSQSS